MSIKDVVEELRYCAKKYKKCRPDWLERSALLLESQEAELKQLRREQQKDKPKALRFDLDQAGIEQREKEAVELVELRAEVERLKGTDARWSFLLDLSHKEAMKLRFQNQELVAENYRLKQIVSKHKTSSNENRDDE